MSLESGLSNYLALSAGCGGGTCTDLVISLPYPWQFSCCPSPLFQPHLLLLVFSPSFPLAVFLLLLHIQNPCCVVPTKAAISLACQSSSACDSGWVSVCAAAPHALITHDSSRYSLKSRPPASRSASPAEFSPPSSLGSLNEVSD